MNPISLRLSQVAGKWLEERHLVEMLVPEHVDLFCSLTIIVLGNADLSELIPGLHEAFTQLGRSDA